VRIRAALLAGLLAVPACTGGGDGSAAIAELAGTVEVFEGDGWSAVGDAVPNVSRLRLQGEDAFVVLEHALGRIRIAPAESGERAEVHLDETAIDLRYGDVVVTLGESPVTVRVPSPGLTVLSEAGTIRVTDGVYTRVATYAGSAVATLIDRDLFVPAWHEASLVAGDLPNAPIPTRLRATDAMDQFAASEVLALDAELLALRRGFEAEFGKRIRRIRDLDAIAEDAKRNPFTFVEPVLASWDSGDVLVGVVLALLLEATGQGALPEMFARVRETFDRGASWGVISAIHGFTADTIVDRVSRAVALRSGEVEPGRGEPINEPPPRVEPTTFPRPTSSPAPSPTANPTPTRSRSPRPTPTTTSSNTSPPPSPSPSPSTTSSDPSPPVTPPPSPSPPVTPPSGSCDPVQRVFGTCS
jgi:hypothetical protein